LIDVANAFVGERRERVEPAVERNFHDDAEKVLAFDRTAVRAQPGAGEHANTGVHRSIDGKSPNAIGGRRFREQSGLPIGRRLAGARRKRLRIVEIERSGRLGDHLSNRG